MLSIKRKDQRKWYKMSTFEEIYPEFNECQLLESVARYAFEGLYPSKTLAWQKKEQGWICDSTERFVTEPHLSTTCASSLSLVPRILDHAEPRRTIVQPGSGRLRAWIRGASTPTFTENSTVPAGVWGCHRPRGTALKFLALLPVVYRRVRVSTSS